MSRIDLLKQISLFAGLTEVELEILARDFIQRQFQPGEIIFQQGDPGQVLYLIETGQVRIFVAGEDGQETSVIVYGPHSIFGELALIDDLPRSASATAMGNTVVHTLARDRFREHMRRFPQLAFSFLKALSERLRYNTQQMESLTLLDVPKRLARKLLEFADSYGRPEPEGVRITLSLTQSDLASLTGATRESINKALGSFKRQGLITMLSQGSITILDPDGLRELISS